MSSLRTNTWGSLRLRRAVPAVSCSAAAAPDSERAEPQRPCGAGLVRGEWRVGDGSALCAPASGLGGIGRRLTGDFFLRPPSSVFLGT